MLERGGVRQTEEDTVMRASLDTRLTSSLNLTLILLSSLFVSVSLSSSSCELQGRFNLNRMYKAGDFVLGGLTPFHYRPVYPELSFTSKQEPTCVG